MLRARQNHQKLERREAILSAALETLADTPFQDITMAHVAARAGLVKGTLYLYFVTREELFLEVLRDQFHGWFWDLETGLEALPARRRLEATARMIARATSSRPAFRILLGALHGILENNLPEPTALAFHRELMSRGLAMGTLLERALPFLHEGQGIHLLLHVQALIIGWQTVAGPTSGVRRIQQKPDLDPLRPDFAHGLQRGMEVLMIGLREENRRQRMVTAPPAPAPA